ncbi:MAG: aspartate-semialdehyde dehydrogenase [Candidatus Omnitrophica bacterium]|nr:aspartate-semialdehyde dehydrogenase [Candidatus Omnitrophota bacterium]
MKKYNVCIVGIRGAVGNCMFETLKERNFPVGELRLLSQNPSEANRKYEINGKEVKLSLLTPDAFKGMDIGLFSPGADISAEFAPHAAKAGCVVIDNTSFFRMHDDVPLVVPEVNPEDIRKHKNIIANPNCSTIQMVVALKPLHDYAKIKRIVVSTYQAVSGAGAEAVEELRNQIKGDMTVKKFQYQIAQNLIPQIDVFVPNFYTKEEMKMVNETKKIMGDNSIQLTATCVRVPVFGAHSEAVNIETEKKITRAKAIELLSKAPGVTIMDDVSKSIYPMPLFIEGKDDTFVGRIREDESIPNGLNLWVVSDNLRKGAALNAIQIAEKMIEMKLI